MFGHLKKQKEKVIATAFGVGLSWRSVLFFLNYINYLSVIEY
jgi:hypothetical protein